MKDGTCPKCASTDVRVTTVVNTKMVPYAREFNMYICTACGYFEQYVADLAKLASVAEQWSPVSG
jgi:predicted nucleic-acid-binding Zn-ribbon protein